MGFAFFKTKASSGQTISREARAASAARWERPAVQQPQRRRLRVLEVRPETANAASFFVEPVDGEPLRFRAGQYLTHCLDIKGRRVRRAYSLSTPEGVSPAGFSCKRVAGGLVSNYLLDELQTGAEYEFLGPNGDFVLGADETVPLVMVAAGSGITPIISLLETALARDPTRDCQLLYGNRSQSETIFSGRIRALQAQFPSLRVAHILSQPEPDWQGETGRIDAARVLRGRAPGADPQFYICGPGAMMAAVVDGLLAAGVEPARICRESFASATHAAGKHPDQPQAIHFSRSDIRVTQQPGQSILDAGLAAGVALQFSCAVGGCAACKLQIIEGEVMLDEPNCLDAAERDQGFTLACSAYATGSVVVDA